MDVPLAEMRALVDESKEPCPLCNCTNALNPHRMCRRKVDVLAVLARFLHRGETWCRVEHGRGVQGLASKEWVTAAYRADQHAMRAVWFGLAEHQGPRQSNFKITQNGLRFLRGDLSVPAKILCRGGRVIHRSIEHVRLADIRDVNLDAAYWDAYPWSDFLDDDEPGQRELFA